MCVFFMVLVAGAGFEPRCMHKQNCFQLPQVGMAATDYDYIIVRSDVAALRDQQMMRDIDYNISHLNFTWQDKLCPT